MNLLASLTSTLSPCAFASCESASSSRSGNASPIAISLTFLLCLEVDFSVRKTVQCALCRCPKVVILSATKNLQFWLGLLALHRLPIYFRARRSERKIAILRCAQNDTLFLN